MSKAKLIIIATFVLGVFGMFPDKLSDFKDAVRAARNREGCTSIPYSDLRSNCDSQDREVDDWCEGRKGPASCDEGRTRDAKNAVEREKRNVQELKDKKSRLESDKSRASTDDEKNKIAKDIEQVERDIYEGGKRIDEAEKNLEARKKLVEDAIYNIGKCIDYRRAVMNVYAAALDKVRTEDETPEIKDLGRELRDHYESTKKGHEIYLTNRDKGMETCKNERP